MILNADLSRTETYNNENVTTSHVFTSTLNVACQTEETVKQEANFEAAIHLTNRVEALTVVNERFLNENKTKSLRIEQLEEEKEKTLKFGRD